LVTPLLDRDQIDVDGTRRLIEHVIDGGVSGIFILGTTGEAPSLSYRIRREFIELVCETVKSRVRVLVGVTDTAFVETTSLAKFAADQGADAVVLSTPYYFPAGQTELTLYVDHIVENLSLPLMLYNMPSLTKVWFEYETLQKLSEHDQIVGVKDSSGDLDYFQQIMDLKEQRPDWSMFIGPEHLTAEAVQMGASGGVNGGANVCPALFTSYYQAAVTGNEADLESLQKQVDDFQAIYQVGKYASRHIKATKCALSINGICSDHMAEPFNHFLPPQRAKVQAILDRLKL
jgi:4-hydroxy-tetrahydrodipicolinate synthase